MAAVASVFGTTFKRRLWEENKQKTETKKQQQQKKNPKQTMDREKNCYECTDCSVPID